MESLVDQIRDRLQEVVKEQQDIVFQAEPKEDYLRAMSPRYPHMMQVIAERVSFILALKTPQFDPDVVQERLVGLGLPVPETVRMATGGVTTDFVVGGLIYSEVVGRYRHQGEYELELYDERVATPPSLMKETLVVDLELIRVIGVTLYPDPYSARAHQDFKGRVPLRHVQFWSKKTVVNTAGTS